MLLADSQIAVYSVCQQMIEPYTALLIREEHRRRIISYGQSSYGYDLRLSDREFWTFQRTPGEVVDPKRFDPKAHLRPAQLHVDKDGSTFFILPAHSYGLGVAKERFKVPSNVTSIILGKSTYARCGIIVNATPAEACLASDTEVLCRTGWKPISEVLTGEEVLCLDNDKAVYQPVKNFHRYYFNGRLLHFKSRYVSQLVTPAHKMWAAKVRKRVEVGAVYPSGRVRGVKRDKNVDFSFERVEASSIFGKHNWYLNRDVNWVGAPLPNLTRIGAFECDTLTWLRFLGCWLGDGSAFVQEHGNYIVKLAVVTKDNKRQYFESVLKQMGVNYRLGDRGFSFQNKDVCLYLKQFSGAYNKRVPRAYMNASVEQLQALYEGLMQSDGCLSTGTYTTVSEQLADDVQEISFKIGGYGSRWTRLVEFKGKGSLMHYSRFSERNQTPSKICPENCEEVPYAGFVYDLTVPSHVFLIRHDGKVSWTGNSWQGHLTLEFSNSSDSDCRIYANEGVAQALFFEGDVQCDVTYSDRKGKYQDQPEAVVVPKV